jgi:hypothetical protein
MRLICDKTEKITILTFVNVKKKQRPKALLLRLKKNHCLNAANATNNMAETAIDIHNFSGNTG